MKIELYVKSLSDSQLHRFHCRIWQWIERRYGPGSWDYPTLYATFPHCAMANKVIVGEKAARWAMRGSVLDKQRHKILPLP